MNHPYVFPSQRNHQKHPSSQALSRLKDTKDAYTLILPASTKGLIFENDEQKVKYETLRARKTSKQEFWHADSLRQLEMLNDVVTIFSNLGCMEYIDMNCACYDQLIIEFLSSLNVDWAS